MTAEPPESWSAHDLRWVISTGLERGQPLLSAGERAVAEQMLALPDAPLGVYARLSARRSVFQLAEALGESHETLDAAGLVCRFVPWSIRAERSTVAQLKAGAKRLGLRRSGSRAQLVERLAAHTHWSDQRWVRVRHTGLVRRLERWAFLRAWPDRSSLVVERLGHVQWPQYPLSSGTALFSTRRSMLAWEAQLHPTTPEQALEGLASGATSGPGRLNLGRTAARHILESARQLERSAELDRAGDLYQGLAVAYPRYHTRCVVRRARVLEAKEQPAEALALLRSERPRATGPDRLALNRAGRRLARTLRVGWAPDRPLPALHTRSLSLPLCPAEGPRPRWGSGLHIEAAIIALLAEHGRVAHHVEGGLWRTLFALLFAPRCYFVPLPGQLPVPRLAGPLDLGTAAFAIRRPSQVQSTRERILAGEGPDLVSESYERFAPARLAGCSWHTVHHHRHLVSVLGPDLLLGVLDRILDRGFSILAGLPDLLVLPGPELRLPRAIPGRVSRDLCLVELKSPSDTLSDAQRLWLAELSELTRVEVWKVTAQR